MILNWIFFFSSFVVGENTPFTWRLAGNSLMTGETGSLILGLDSPVKDLRVSLGKTQIPVFSCPQGKGRNLRAFLPVSLAAKPGPRPLKFSWKEGDKMHSQTFEVTIQKKPYPIEKLKVAPERVDLGRKEILRVALEAKIMKRIYESPRPVGTWLKNFDFKMPVPSKVTSPFGTSRNFNGRLRSFHTGIDLRGSEKTKVVATHKGEVRTIKSLFFAGTTVVVDHGLGLFSIYSHLSKVLVKVGDKVNRGGLLGYVGKSGRVTAPHLHWGFKVHGVAVAPLQFLEVAHKICQSR